jgi:hypothetical protein
MNRPPADEVLHRGTTLEANAALRSILKRDSGEAYADFLKRLQRSLASIRRRGNNWRSLDRKRRKKVPTTIGKTRTIPMPGSRG